MSTADLASALAEANRHWQAGQYRTAVQRYVDVADSHPTRSEAITPALRALLGVGQIDQALKRAARSLRDGVATPDILLIAGLGRLAEQPQVTISVLERLLREFPTWDQPRTGLFHLDAERMANLDLQPRFPASPIEYSYVDSAAWLAQCSIPVPWVAFPTQVMEQALRRMQHSGMIVECGVYFGRSLAYIADRTRLPIHGFDSFSGLPEAWLDKPAGAYSTGGLLPDMAEHVHLHQGWFEETLPDFATAYAGERIALLHLDCDLYSSTATALEALGPLCDADTVYVFDDLIGIADWREHEFKALNEFADAREARIVIEAAAVTAREVAVRIV